MSRYTTTGSTPMSRYTTTGSTPTVCQGILLQDLHLCQGTGHSRKNKDRREGKFRLCCLGDRIDISSILYQHHRRRIKTAVWGTELIQFLVTLAILH